MVAAHLQNFHQERHFFGDLCPCASHGPQIGASIISVGPYTTTQAPYFLTCERTVSVELGASSLSPVMVTLSSPSTTRARRAPGSSSCTIELLSACGSLMLSWTRSRSFISESCAGLGKSKTVFVVLRHGCISVQVAPAFAYTRKRDYDKGWWRMASWVSWLEKRHASLPALLETAKVPNKGMTVVKAEHPLAFEKDAVEAGVCGARRRCARRARRTGERCAAWTSSSRDPPRLGGRCCGCFECQPHGSACATSQTSQSPPKAQAASEEYLVPLNGMYLRQPKDENVNGYQHFVLEPFFKKMHDQDSRVSSTLHFAL